MKKIYLTALALGACTLMQAQDTYLNERLTNTTGELYGTSRYVGMGGSMGALGADMSCMSFNPAGIGLYRRSDLSLTAGAIWNNERPADVRNSRGTFDQIGFVYAFRTENENLPFFNVGFNYQKKLNFFGSFLADNNNLKGLSQMDQLAELASDGFGTSYNLAGAAQDYEFLTPVKDAQGNVQRYYNKFGGQLNRYTHQQWGSLGTFDINLSANINDRVYLGVTCGFENMSYNAETDYYEESAYINDNNELKLGDYSLYNNYKIEGWGFNLKFGAIVRPFEDRPFRVGIAMETPTWYQLTSSTLNQLTDQVDHVSYQYNANSLDESYLEYALHSPIKGRFSMGSTVGNYLAWNIDYELANYGKTNMGYPKSYNYDGSARLFNNEPDKAMNQQTRDALRFQHTIRAGVEVKPSTEWAFRLGYNYSTSPYKADYNKFDQYSLDSYAMDYLTSTCYMKTKAANTLTLGMGYKHKSFYLDIAYKVRAQKADFYAFDSSFTDAGTQFTTDNPDLASVKLDPVEVNLGRQQLTCTMGFKF